MEGGHALRRCAARRGRRRWAAPVHRARKRGAPSPFDRDASHFVYDRWHGWWKLDRDGNAPAYPFGFGLGYTTFELEEASAVVGDGRDRDPHDVAQHGITAGHRRRADLFGRPAPTRRVRAQRSTRARPPARHHGAVRTLAVRDVEQHAMVVRPGTYELRVARSAADEGIGLTVTVSSAA